jgi:hypothetical protein
MGDHLKKVQSGDPLVVPAATWNAFIDAAEDYRQRLASIPKRRLRCSTRCACP